MLEQLPVAVAVAVRRLDLARRVEGQPALRRVEAEAVGGPARDHDVVVLAVGQRAEDRLHDALALVDEDDLVALAVAVEVVRLGLRDADADLDVGVVLEHPPAEHAVAHRLQAHRVGEPVHVGVGHPLLELDRREVADVLHAARRPQVVEDRLVAGEALEAEHLLDQQRRVAVGRGGLRVAELDVALLRDLAQAVVTHQVLSSAVLLGSVTRPRNSSVPDARCSIAHRNGRSSRRSKGGAGRRRRRSRARSRRSPRRRGCPARRGRRGRGAARGRAPSRAGALEHAVEVGARREHGPRPSARQRRARGSSSRRRAAGAAARAGPAARASAAGRARAQAAASSARRREALAGDHGDERELAARLPYGSRTAWTASSSS